MFSGNYLCDEKVRYEHAPVNEQIVSAETYRVLEIHRKVERYARKQYHESRCWDFIKMRMLVDRIELETYAPIRTEMEKQIPLVSSSEKIWISETYTAANVHMRKIVPYRLQGLFTDSSYLRLSD